MLDLIVAVVASVLITAIVAGLTAALVLERAHRLALAGTVLELQRRLDALDRVDRNPLYRESMENQQARQLRAAADVATGVEFMIQAIRILNPELLKGKGKK